MSENLRIWNRLRTPPPDALKPIQAGRLKGKRDISPQWRLEAMTETFGPVGIGWSYKIEKLWTEPGSEGQVAAFAEIALRIRVDGEWSEPIPGIGGSMLIESEKRGLHTSDEAYKMAITDALSVAMKQLGVAADIYRGLADRSKYRPEAKPQGGDDLPQQSPQGGNGNGSPLSGETRGYIVSVASDPQVFSKEEIAKARAFIDAETTTETAGRKFLNRLQDIKKFRLWFETLSIDMQTAALDDFREAFSTADGPSTGDHFRHIREFVAAQVDRRAA